MIDSQSGNGDGEPTYRNVSPNRRVCGLKNAETAPLVSVVVTCYNSTRHLAEALTSVLKQTYTKIEIIVVDDGSTDSTSAIAQYDPVTYIYQSNQGV
jgi:cellulose synthase/poly-beta-1,6-N-acetylglucosamine synthase-like glycosyltransferase